MKARVLALTVGVALACGFLSLLAAYAIGIRFFVVTTPSMATAAPVGSLVVTRQAHEYASGELIAFWRGDRVYTHRIVEVRDGKFVTQGDLNATPDTQLVAKSDVIGSSIFVGRYLGWVWQAAPMLIIGLAAVFLIAQMRWVGDSWRGTVRLLGSCVVAIVVSIIINPWFRLVMLGFVPDDRGGVMMHVVNTGIYPIALDGGGRFGPGETADVWVNQVDAAGHYLYMPHPSLGFPGIFVAFAFCIAPLVIALSMKIPHTDGEVARGLPLGVLRRNRVLLAAGVTFSLALVSFQLSAIAGLTARITNSTDTVANRTYFSCTAAVGGTSASGSYNVAKPIFAYRLGTAQATSTPVTDLTGNGFNGTLAVASTVQASSACVNDSPQAAMNFSTALQQCVYTPGAGSTAPTVFSLNVWFKTTTASNGKLIGFVAAQTGQAAVANSRHLYIDAAGKLVFGLYSASAGIVTASSPNAVTDGQWHHAVATLSSSNARLYLDGNLVATSTTPAGLESWTGWWRIGCGPGGNWRNADGTVYNIPTYFTGQMQYAAVYDGVTLTQAQVTEIYQSSRP